jgi:hypothetical protein
MKHGFKRTNFVELIDIRDKIDQSALLSMKNYQRRVNNEENLSSSAGSFTCCTDGVVRWKKGGGGS